jgi:DNA repair protein SbcD/Mre11
MKFLFFTDTHIRGTTPKNRKDHFIETLKDKFREVGEIADELGVDYILHGGDWFDRPDISPAIVREFAILIQNLNRPIYTVAGNHDIYGHNPETIGRTMLGLLEGIGILTLMKYEDELVLEKDGVRVQLTGKPYNYDIDGENFKQYYIVKKRKDVDFAINIVHGMLLSKPFFEGIQYVLLEDIRGTEADITLAGHYHNGFGVKVLDGKYFINPGSLVRVANSLWEIKRMPKVVYIEFDAGRMNVREIELKCAQPGEDVLDRLELERSQDRNIKLHEFYEGITAAQEFRKIDINGMIEQIAANQELSPRVKDEAVRRISIARENLSTGEDQS